MAASDASPFPIKNQAYRVTFPILDADGDLVTAAATLDSEVSKDGGTFADCTNEATEIATSSGMYFLDLTATEMNADTVAIIVKTGTAGAKTTPIVLYPVTLSEAMIGVNAVQAGGTAWGSGAITAAAIAASALNGKGDWNIGKTGYALSAAGVQAIWDALTSALTTVGSIGKLLVDNINATISSRSSHTAADVWASVTRTLTAGTNIVLAKGTGVTGFTDLSAAQVNAEVVDALNVDTYAEPGQGAPPATASLATKIGYQYKSWRNKKEQNATLFSLYSDDTVTVDQKATVSDNGTTTSVGEMATGA